MTHVKCSSDVTITLTPEPLDEPLIIHPAEGLGQGHMAARVQIQMQPQSVPADTCAFCSEKALSVLSSRRCPPRSHQDASLFLSDIACGCGPAAPPTNQAFSSRSCPSPVPSHTAGTQHTHLWGRGGFPSQNQSLVKSSVQIFLLTWDSAGPRKRL